MKSDSACLVAALLASGLAAGMFFWSDRPAAGQMPPGVAMLGVRYQFLAVGTTSDPTLYVFDTETGQVWERRRAYPNNKWVDLGSPVVKLEAEK